MIKVLIFFVAAIAAMAYFILPGSSGTISSSTENSKSVTFEKIASLPGEIQESSGVVVVGKGQYLTHNDAGNKPYLYKINRKAQIEETIKLNLPNVDWEDLTTAPDGTIYIADTGNNNNKRRELAIYKVSLQNPQSPEAIRFTYEDQKEYPPAKDDRNFDCEAIFYYDGSLYLISKDRGREKTAKVYRLPTEAGNYRAKLIGKHDLGNMVTGAAISPNGQKVVLLSEGKVHLFTGYNSPSLFYQGKHSELRLKDAGQTEGVAFEDNNTLIITSEGGNLYSYAL